LCLFFSGISFFSKDSETIGVDIFCSGINFLEIPSKLLILAGLEISFSLTGEELSSFSTNKTPSTGVLGIDISSFFSRKEDAVIKTLGESSFDGKDSSVTGFIFTGVQTEGVSSSIFFFILSSISFLLFIKNSSSSSSVNSL